MKARTSVAVALALIIVVALVASARRESTGKDGGEDADAALSDSQSPSPTELAMSFWEGKAFGDSEELMRNPQIVASFDVGPDSMLLLATGTNVAGQDRVGVMELAQPTQGSASGQGSFWSIVAGVDLAVERRPFGLAYDFQEQAVAMLVSVDIPSGVTVEVGGQAVTIGGREGETVPGAEHSSPVTIQELESYESPVDRSEGLVPAEVIYVVQP